VKLIWPEQALRWKGALEKYKYVCLVVVVGLVLLMLPVGRGQDAADAQAQESASGDAFDLTDFEHRLEEALSKIDGAGEAKVVLTLTSGSRQILAQDLQRNGEQSSASTTVTVGKGSGTQEVVALQTLAPNFRGALVVCPGGDDPQVRLRLVEAVSALTGLKSDRISICRSST
jgi:stage III sporulation protein AG